MSAFYKKELFKHHYFGIYFEIDQIEIYVLYPGKKSLLERICSYIKMNRLFKNSNYYVNSLPCNK